MEKKAKIQKTKTNTTINIPKDWADYLGYEKGVQVKLVLKDKKITITKED